MFLGDFVLVFYRVRLDRDPVEKVDGLIERTKIGSYLPHNEVTKR